MIQQSQLCVGVYPKELKSSPRDTYTPIFSAALFTTAQILETTQVSVYKQMSKANVVYMLTHMFNLKNKKGHYL